MADESRAATITAAEPQLFVDSLEIACRFYVETLGFAVAFSHGDPPFYAQVVRDAARLNLRRIHGLVFDRGFRDREPDALSATLVLGDPEPLYREFEAAGVSFYQALRMEPWGARTFIVSDPDGNLIAFAGGAGAGRAA
jgi:catechol 2,3-dioxygenase-like lactoylglutathione lyase family enzyme